ncbi:MAG: molybdopterin-dependent oxidoreductase [Desulfotomaculaceae bacterium]|nr:molybdopterin-dependent oxidoreductase [Desulfotomaculaceae bacterium]
MEIIKTDCGLCVNDCGIDCYVEDGKLIKIEGTPGHVINNGKLCSKGKYRVETVYSPNRLKHPIKKVDGRFQKISWDQAYEEIASKLLALKEQYGAHTLFSSTGSVGIEHFEFAAFNQRLTKAYGTPNMFNPEGICFRTRILARQIAFGKYTIEEPRNAKLIILWGHNPDESYFVIGDDIRKRIKTGELKLIVIDVRRIPLAKEESIYLQPRPGTDAAIALAMINVIIEEGIYDHEFVENWTTGFEKLAEHVKQYTPEKAEEISGVPAASIRMIARMFANTKGACILEGIGHMNQYANGLQTERCFGILMAITGNIDRPGGWVTCPQIRLSDLRVPIEEKALGYDEYPLFHQFNKTPPPYGSASMMTEAMITGKPYPVKALITSGGNQAITFPDTKRFLEGIKNLELFVAIDPCMTETTRLADYVLPACTTLEETGIGGFTWCVSYCVPYIMLRKKVIEPLYESKPIWKIWSELGHKMGYGELFPWKTDEEVAKHFLSASSVTYEQLLENPEGMFYGEIEYEIYKEKGFRTESKKVELYSARMEALGAEGLPSHVEPQQSAVANPELAKEYPETLLTGARHQEYINAQGHDIPGLEAKLPEAEAWISPVTAKKYDIINGEMVGVETTQAMIKIKAKVTDDIRPGAVSVPHGWAEANCNLLLDSTVRDNVSSYITLNGNACRLVKLA